MGGRTLLTTHHAQGTSTGTLQVAQRLERPHHPGEKCKRGETWDRREKAPSSARLGLTTVHSVSMQAVNFCSPLAQDEAP